ncbi:MAG TPA: hypothetical protein VNF07_01900 [Acidimicrobiales bacterium]|nr:hypothetical protein [Acidimicrobiales bacterium]
MSRRTRLLICELTATLLLPAAVVVLPTTANAAPSANASCSGTIVAATNHDSGPFGASGNPNASAGPGYFLHSGAHEGITTIRAEFC